MRRSYSITGPQQHSCYRQPGQQQQRQQIPQGQFPQQQQQQQNPNWAATAEFVSRAKQAALQQTGNTHLVSLFGPNGGSLSQGGPSQGPPQGSGGGGFMRPPMPTTRISVQSGGAGGGGGIGGCQCPNCSGGGAPAIGNPFQGQGPMDGQSADGGQARGGVMTFTTQLAGLPVPEHPSGAFPGFDFVMVPPGPPQQGGIPNGIGGGGGGIGGGSCNCPNCSGGSGSGVYAEGNSFQGPPPMMTMMQGGNWVGPQQQQQQQHQQQLQQQQNGGGLIGGGGCGGGFGGMMQSNALF